MYEIRIQKVNRGWIVTAGCQKLVFTDAALMVDAFRDYMLEGSEYAANKWCDAPQALGLAAPASPPVMPTLNDRYDAQMAQVSGGR